MRKKVFVLLPLLLLVLTMGLVGCSETTSGNNQTNEFLGEFSGEVGSLTFEPGSKVLVNLTGESVKVLKEHPNNTAYRYAFQTGKQVLPYEEANGIFLYENEGDKLAFAYIAYTGEQDKMTIRPVAGVETVLYRKK